MRADANDEHFCRRREEGGAEREEARGMRGRGWKTAILISEEAEQ